MDIRIEKLSKEEIEKKGIFNWPIWEKEISRFDWHYDSQEQCYILQGNVRIEPSCGEVVEFGPGDFVTFPKDMDCVWEIKEAVRKHYNFN